MRKDLSRVPNAVAEFAVQRFAESQFKPSHIVAIADEEEAQLLALYRKMDKRGKLTIMRLASVMPKNEADL